MSFNFNFYSWEVRSSYLLQILNSVNLQFFLYLLSFLLTNQTIHFYISIFFSYRLAKYSQWYSPQANNLQLSGTQNYYIHDMPLTSVSISYTLVTVALTTPVTASLLPMPFLLCFQFLVVLAPTPCTDSCISQDKLGFPT